MSRRREPVSDEDKALFHHAVRGTAPLAKRPGALLSVGPPRKIFGPLPMHHGLQSLECEPAPAIRGHTESRLRRGRVEPEARLDLHGHSYEGAYRTLVTFLTKAYADGKSLVLVITGKGGVLRPHLPLWLNGPELRDVVIGIRQAHARHGGAGAFYVALHRRKPSGIRS